jgi:hypothetical protein
LLPVASQTCTLTMPILLAPSCQAALLPSAISNLTDLRTLA